jgi:hypothetical protein
VYGIDMSAIAEQAQQIVRDNGFEVRDREGGGEGEGGRGGEESYRGDWGQPACVPRRVGEWL